MKDDDGPVRGRPVIASAWAFEEGVTPPQVYQNAGIHLFEAIADDPAWQQWWAASGLTNVRLHPYYTRTGGGEHPDQRRSRGGEAVVHCTFDVARFDTTDDAGQVELAAQDVRTLFELIRAERSLAPLPPIPAAGPTSSAHEHDGIPDGQGIDAALDAVTTMMKQQGLSKAEIKRMVAHLRRVF